MPSLHEILSIRPVEGNWTPIDSSGAGLAFVGAAGRYTRLRNLIFCFGVLQYPVTADASNTLIGGLPFTAAAPAGIGYGGYIWETNSTLYITPLCVGTTIRLEDNTATRIINSQMSNRYIRFTLAYRLI